MKSATYWTNAIKQLKSGIKSCQPQNRATYTHAIRKANKELLKLRHAAGVI